MLKQSLSHFLTSLNKESDNLVLNISQTLKPQFDTLKPEQSCKTLQDLSELIYKSPIPTMCTALAEIGAVRAFDHCLSKVFKEVMKLPDDFMSQVDSRDNRI